MAIIRSHSVAIGLAVFICIIALHNESIGSHSYLGFLQTSNAGQSEAKRATSTALQGESLVTHGKQLQGSRGQVSNPSFDPQDFTFENLGCHLNQTSATGRCGHTKCFYILATDNKIGYTVSILNGPLHRAIDRGWEYSLHLENTYGIPKIPLEPPRIIENNISEALTACLDAKRDRMEGNEEEYNIPKFTRGRFTDKEKDYHHKSGLLVQKNRVIPEPNVLFKCAHSTERTTAALSFERYWTHVRKCDVYLRNIQMESKHAKYILENERGLTRDFQVMIDTSGRFHYIDLGHHAPRKGKQDPSNSSSTPTRGKYFLHCLESFDFLFQLLSKNCHRYSGNHGTITTSNQTFL